ncbi:MAG: YbaK/EbsC family protein [Nanoarchaeota archaeon]|nr:YbaK/EbsC family protein [Nanoarchaeota archaeon]
MQDIKTYLKNLNINFKTISHIPVYTCEEAEKYANELKGVHSKNLFLKNKKENKFFLIIIPAGRKLEIKKIEALLNEKLTFADKSDLNEILNITTGAVSPFALINDKDKKTQLIISNEILISEYVAFHPNINTETLELTSNDFKRFLESIKIKPIII